MDQPDKLPLLIQSFRLMLGQLRVTDEIAIVTYAGNAGQVLEPTSATEKPVFSVRLHGCRPEDPRMGRLGYNWPIEPPHRWRLPKR